MDHLTIDILPLDPSIKTPHIREGVLYLPIREGTTFFSKEYTSHDSPKGVVKVFNRESFFDKVGEKKFKETREFIKKKRVRKVKIYTKDLDHFSSAYALASKLTKNARMFKWKDVEFETEWDLVLFLKCKPWSIRRQIVEEIKQETKLLCDYSPILLREKDTR